MERNAIGQRDGDDRPQDANSEGTTEEAVHPEEEPVCAACGGAITIDDLICPHCGESLAAG